MTSVQRSANSDCGLIHAMGASSTGRMRVADNLNRRMHEVEDATEAEAPALAPAAP